MGGMRVAMARIRVRKQKDRKKLNRKRCVCCLFVCLQYAIL